MKERKAGNIITISSSAGRRPHPRSPIPYAAAKAGIQILTDDVAAQVCTFGISVNCIARETILTDRNKERIPETQRQMLIDAHPIRRLGMPEYVARAALFLVSNEAGWITGIVLDVAGGAAMAYGLRLPPSSTGRPSSNETHLSSLASARVMEVRF